MTGVMLISRALLLSLVLCVSCPWASAADPSPDFARVRRSSRVARFSDYPGGLYPRTKYCGRAVNPNANIQPPWYLEKEDMCCKALHDCPGAVILPGQTDATTGITNACLYPQRDCACDDAFFKCLKGVGTPAASAIGSIYFFWPLRKCYTQDFPLKCRGLPPLIPPFPPQQCPACVFYCTDTAAAKKWHTRPVPAYGFSNTALIAPSPC